MDERLLMSRLAHPPFTSIVQFCDNEINPGIDERQIWVNYQTTLDQLRIEEVLESIVTKSSSILHIGVGNSSLGKRLSPRVAFIHGVTLYDEEKLFADTMNISDYTVTTTNKYSKEMERLTNRFDFIIDNNPASFACCLFHLCRMMITYVKLLKDEGMILTAEPGLSWVNTGHDPDWSLKWADWASLGEALAMPTSRLSEFVYAMRRRDHT